MSYKITTQNFKNIHYYAQCESCEFSIGITEENSEDDVRRIARAHVKTNGHNVTLSYGGEILYKPL